MYFDVGSRLPENCRSMTEQFLQRPCARCFFIPARRCHGSSRCRSTGVPAENAPIVTGTEEATSLPNQSTDAISVPPEGAHQIE